MTPKKLENKLRKEEEVKKAITIEKKKEIVQKYESGFRVTDLANMYSMSKSTISTILLVFLVNYAHYTTLFLLWKS
jgi:Mor family transcriptional regulator